MGTNKNRKDHGVGRDPLAQDKEFLKNHKQIDLDMHLYCGETIERIEKHCGCQVIVNPHFDGISFFVKNEYYRDVQDMISKIREEDSARRERIATKKREALERVKLRFEDRMAKCKQPSDEERRFAENCLKTLKIEDVVRPSDAQRYRELYKEYQAYFDLVGWPDDVEGSSARRYLNTSFIKTI